MAQRKTRTWKCPCCGVAHYWRERGQSHTFRSCPTCSVELRPARTWSTSKRCAHVRVQQKRTEFEKRLGDRPRTRAQKPLTLTPKLRRLWAEVRKARTFPAVQRRAEKFLEELAEHVRQRPHKDAWTLKVGRDGTVQKHWGGMTGVPKIVLKDYIPLAHGQYVRSLVDGRYAIELATKNLHPDPRLTKTETLRRTLVHELCHWLDSEAETDFGRGHDRLWEKRLARLEQILPFTEHGSPRYETRRGSWR